MKKYKLEVALLSIFASLIVALLWGTLASRFASLPYLLMGACAIVLAAVLVPWTGKSGDGQEEGSDRERYAPKYFAQALVSSVVGIALIIGLAAVLNRERFSKTIDLTERKVNSLSEETTKFISTLDKDVNIYCIPSMEARERYCEENAYLRRLYTETATKIQHGVVDLRDIATLQKIKPTGYSRLVIMSDANRSEIVGKVTESKLTNALINLIKSKKVVYFLVGSGEPSTGLEGERNYANLAETLKSRAYEVKEHPITAGELPADAQLVVAGSSTVPYGSVVENILRRFLAKGGRLILTINPYRDPGLGKLFADLGVKLESTLLVHNQGATQLGAQLAQLQPMRPPVVVGEFSRESPITSVLSPRDIALADGARPMSVLQKPAEAAEVAGLKLKHTSLMSAFHAAPVTITEEARNKLPLDGSLGVQPDAGYDPKKTFPVALQVEIEGASKLAEGVPAASVAMGGSGTAGVDTAKDSKDTKDASKDGSKEPKDTSEVVVLGFDVAGRYDGAAAGNSQILPLTVAHLYRDKELVSIPTKDFAPRQFDLSKNPASFLFLFAGFLPVATALTGFYIWMRRRSA